MERREPAELQGDPPHLHDASLSTWSPYSDQAPSPSCQGTWSRWRDVLSSGTNLTTNKTPPLTEGSLQEKCTSLELAVCQGLLLDGQVESDHPLLMEKWGWAGSIIQTRSWT